LQVDVASGKNAFIYDETVSGCYRKAGMRIFSTGENGVRSPLFLLTQDAGQDFGQFIGQHAARERG